MNKYTVSENLLNVADEIRKTKISSFAVNCRNGRREAALTWREKNPETGKTAVTSAGFSIDAAGDYASLISMFAASSLKKVDVRHKYIYFLFTNGEYAEYKPNRSGNMEMVFSGTDFISTFPRIFNPSSINIEPEVMPWPFNPDPFLQPAA